MTFVNAHFFLKTLKAHKALIGFICIILSCTWANVFCKEKLKEYAMEGKEWTYFWLPMDLLVNKEAYK